MTQPDFPSARFRDADPLHDIAEWERDWLRGFDGALAALPPGRYQILMRTDGTKTVLPDPPIASIEGAGWPVP